MFRSLLFACFLLQAGIADAQLSKNEVEDLLTNGKMRDWQFRTYKKSLGGSCQGDGQLYTFLKNGKLQRKRCRNGQPDYKEIGWKIKPVPNGAEGEWQLELDEIMEVATGHYMQTMRLDLPMGKQHIANQKMMWRVVPNCKACMAETVNFTSKN